MRCSAAREAGGGGGAAPGGGGVLGPWPGQETVQRLVGLVAGAWLRCTDTGQEAGQAEQQQLQPQAEQPEQQQEQREEQGEPALLPLLLSLADVADDMAAFALLELPSRDSGGTGSSSSSSQSSHVAANGAEGLWRPVVQRVEELVRQHVGKGLDTYHRYGRLYDSGGGEAVLGERVGGGGTEQELPDEAAGRAEVEEAGQGDGVDAAALVRVVGALEEAGCLSGGVLMGAGQLLGCVARGQAAALGGGAGVGREGQLGDETDEEEGPED